MLHNKKLSDKARYGITLALGTMVVLWRVFFASNVEITVGTVLIVNVLDLIVTIAVIWLNKDELKAIFKQKFTGKDLLKVIGFFLVYFFMTSVLDLGGGFGFERSPANDVIGEFLTIFPFGAFISGGILAPIWEEVVFRFAGEKLIKNKILFVLITTFLFVFIHTGFALTTGLFYVQTGLTLAIIYLITNDLRLVIILHFIGNNIGWLFMLFGLM